MLVRASSFALETSVGSADHLSLKLPNRLGAGKTTVGQWVEVKGAARSVLGRE